MREAVRSCAQSNAPSAAFCARLASPGFAAALREMPIFNAALSADGENLVYRKYINIGVAVDTPNGLVVPVIRDVDKKGVFEIARDLMEILNRERLGR